MDDKFTSYSNIQNDEPSSNTEDSDYKNLITRLKEISSKIAFLEKTILD